MQFEKVPGAKYVPVLFSTQNLYFLNIQLDLKLFCFFFSIRKSCFDKGTFSPPWAHPGLALPTLDQPVPPWTTHKHSRCSLQAGMAKVVFFFRKKTREQYINAQASKFTLKKVSTKIDISKKVKSDSILFQKGTPFSSTFFLNFDYSTQQSSNRIFVQNQ